MSDEVRVRRARIAVTTELLHDILKLPEHLEIVAVYTTNRPAGIPGPADLELVVQSNWLPPVPFRELPYLEPVLEQIDPEKPRLNYRLQQLKGMPDT